MVIFCYLLLLSIFSGSVIIVLMYRLYIVKYTVPVNVVGVISFVGVYIS